MAKCAVVWLAEATAQQKQEIQRIMNELAEILETRDREIEWYKEQIDWYKNLVKSILYSEGKSDGRKV